MKLYSITFYCKGTDAESNCESMILWVKDEIKHPTNEFFLKELFGVRYNEYEVIQIRKLKTE